MENETLSTPSENSSSENANKYELKTLISLSSRERVEAAKSMSATEKRYLKSELMNISREAVSEFVKKLWLFRDLGYLPIISMTYVNGYPVINVDWEWNVDRW